MEWDLTTIEHHGDCPFGMDCNLLDEMYQVVCVWCFVLTLAEWIADTVLEAKGTMKDLAERADMLTRTIPATRWDAFGF